MKTANRMLEAIKQRDELTANMILIEFGLKWFLFGAAVGWLLCFTFDMTL